MVQHKCALGGNYDHRTGSDSGVVARTALAWLCPLPSDAPRPMTSRTAALISLGCSKNLADSEDLVTALRSVDFGLTKDLATADLVLINTCGFIEGAKQESIGHILAAAEGRKAGAKLFVAGCLTERYLSELQADIPEVDQWVTFKDYDRFPAVVKKHFTDISDHRLRHDLRIGYRAGLDAEGVAAVLAEVRVVGRAEFEHRVGTQFVVGT